MKRWKISCARNCGHKNTEDICYAKQRDYLKLEINYVIMMSHENVNFMSKPFSLAPPFLIEMNEKKNDQKIILLFSCKDKD